MAIQQVVLASGSRWRRELLASTGLAVCAVESGVDEAAITADDPVALARSRARAKAERVARAHPDALVIGADQVVHLEGCAYGKPPDPDAHMAMLQSLRGREHTLTTAVCVVADGVSETFEEHSRVRVRADVTDSEIGAYVASGEARGCAGGYMVERRGAWLVEHVAGDWNNVIGLPIRALVTHLRARGWQLPVTP